MRDGEGKSEREGREREREREFSRAFDVLIRGRVFGRLVLYISYRASSSSLSRVYETSRRVN